MADIQSPGSTASTSISEPTIAEVKPFTVVVENAFLNLRTGAGVAYPVFYVAQRGEQLEVSKSRTRWYRVHLSTNGNRTKTGWIHRDDLKETRVAWTNTRAADHPELRGVVNPDWSTNYALGNLSNADLATIGFGYRGIRALAYEARASWFNGSVFQGWIVNGQLKYEPFYRWKVSPFAVAGYGYMRRTTQLIQQEDNSDQILLVGTGFKVKLSGNYHLRFEYQQLNTLTSQNDNAELDNWQIGLGTYF